MQHLLSNSEDSVSYELPMRSEQLLCAASENKPRTGTHNTDTHKYAHTERGRERERAHASKPERVANSENFFAFSDCNRA